MNVLGGHVGNDVVVEVGGVAGYAAGKYVGAGGMCWHERVEE